MGPIFTVGESEMLPNSWVNRNETWVGLIIQKLQITEHHPFCWSPTIVEGMCTCYWEVDENASYPKTNAYTYIV